MARRSSMTPTPQLRQLRSFNNVPRGTSRFGLFAFRGVDAGMGPASLFAIDCSPPRRAEAYDSEQTRGTEYVGTSWQMFTLSNETCALPNVCSTRAEEKAWLDRWRILFLLKMIGVVAQWTSQAAVRLLIHYTRKCLQKLSAASFFFV